MHSVVWILSLVLLLQQAQNGEPTKTDLEITPDVGKNNDILKLLLLSKHDHDLRNIHEIWNNIRNSVVKAWSFVKNLAENTKQKLDTWINDVKKRANDLNIKFQEHMKHLKEKIEDIIQKTFENSKLVKICLEREAPEIDKMLNKIIKDVSVCMTNNMRSASLLNINLSTVNDTNILIKLEERSKLCEHDLDNSEECLNKVRQDNFNDMQDMETDILKTRIDTRNILDNLLEDLAACSIEGLLEASSIITHEAVIITKCILKPE